MGSLSGKLFGVGLAFATAALVSRWLQAHQLDRAKAERIRSAKLRSQSGSTWPPNARSSDASDLQPLEDRSIDKPALRSVKTQHGEALTETRGADAVAASPPVAGAAHDPPSSTPLLEIHARETQGRERPIAVPSAAAPTNTEDRIQKVEALPKLGSDETELSKLKRPDSQAAPTQPEHTALNLREQVSEKGEIIAENGREIQGREHHIASPPVAARTNIDHRPQGEEAAQKLRSDDTERLKLKQPASRTVPTAPEHAVLNLLEQVSGTGEIIAVTYAYGSRAGQERELTVVSVTEDKTAIKVREAGFPDEKTYVVGRIMRIKTQSGEIATNHTTVARFMEFTNRQRERQNLISTCEFGSLKELNGCRFEVKKESGSIWISNRKNFLITSIEAKSVEWARRAAFGIDLMLSESRGYWVDIQKIMVSGGVYWPNWMELQAAAYKEGQRIAQNYEAANEGKKLAKQPIGVRVDSYAESPLWPGEDCYFMDWLRIFEAPPFDMKEILKLVDGSWLNREEYKEYILSSDGRQRPIEMPNEEISAKTLTKLLENDLAKPEYPLTIESALSRLTLAELRPLAKALGVNTSQGKKSEIVERCIHAMPSDEAQRLIANLQESNSFVLQPPKGLTWEQFQDFKSCYRQMFGMLAEWLDGNPRRPGHPISKLLG